VPKGEIGSLARLGSRKAADKLHCDQHCVMGGSAKERKPPAHFWDEDNECKDAWWRGKTAPMSLAQQAYYNKERYLLATYVAAVRTSRYCLQVSIHCANYVTADVCRAPARRSD
jgi:hypothetical protein